MESSRKEAFLMEIRSISRYSDDPIEYEDYKGGGIRINGFRHIRARLLEQILATYEKRAKYTTQNNRLSICAYDDVNPQACAPTAIENLQSTFKKTAADTRKGNVCVASYAATTVESEDLKRMLLLPDVIDVVLTQGLLQCVSVAKSSLQIVGGLHDLLHRKKMKATPPKRLPARIRRG
jgi:hypothetical protein